MPSCPGTVQHFMASYPDADNNDNSRDQAINLTKNFGNDGNNKTSCKHGHKVCFTVM